MELCGIYKCLHKAGIPMTRIISTGGALSNEILQMKADILGCEIHSVECGQTGAAGGAILGAVSDGIYDTVDAAVKAMVRTQGMAVPDMKRHEAYENKMRIYDTLYAHLRDINHSMDKAVFPDSRYFTAGMK